MEPRAERKRVKQSEQGCLKDFFIRRRRYYIPSGPSRFFTWDSRPEGSAATHGGFKEVKTEPNRLAGMSWIVSSELIGISTGYRETYVNVHTGLDERTYSL